MTTQAPGLALLPTLTITTAITATTPSGAAGVVTGDNVDMVTLQANFTYGSGGTTTNAWVQTSLDGGVTWVDIANFSFTTASAIKVATCVAAATLAPTAPSDGALTANTVLNGVIGDRFRVKTTTTGTYAGSTTLQIVAMFNGKEGR